MTLNNAAASCVLPHAIRIPPSPDAGNTHLLAGKLTSLYLIAQQARNEHIDPPPELQIAVDSYQQ